MRTVRGKSSPARNNRPDRVFCVRVARRRALRGRACVDAFSLLHPPLVFPLPEHEPMEREDEDDPGEEIDKIVWA